MSAALQTIDAPATTLLDSLSCADPSSADLRARAAFWRRYVETTPELSTDQAFRIIANCVALDDRADRMDAPAPVVALVAHKTGLFTHKVGRRSAPKVAKTPTIRPDEFWAMHTRAVDAVRNVWGDRWHVYGLESVPVCVPSRLCTMTGPLGGKIKWRRDWRMPAAKYWPGGALPACGLEVAPPRRDKGPLPGAGVANIVAYQILADKQHRERMMSCDPSYPPMGG